MASVRTADEIRAAVLHTAKEMLRVGLVEGTSGNVSGRLPDGNVVMTPSSLDYGLMQLEDLVTVDLAGKVVEGHRPPTTEKELHLACLRRHPELGAVIHSHALFASMFAVTRQPIPCVLEEFDVYVGGEVPVANYRLTGSDELGEEVASWVGDRGAVLMANHGLLTVGTSVERRWRLPGWSNARRRWSGARVSLARSCRCPRIRWRSSRGSTR